MPGRYKKNKIDYFPHDCIHGRTMQILSTKFGNDGRAFWWTLLEVLGDTENHYFDTRNAADMEYLASKSLLPVISVTEMLGLLALLGAIDSELWENGIIWSQNFVDRISDVYKKRGVPIPVRPSLYTQKDISVTEIQPDHEFLEQESSTPVISGTEIQQSKVKKSKEDIKTPPTPKKKPQPKKPVADGLFDKFWQNYPRKIDKDEAIKSWVKISPNEELAKKIISAVNAQMASGQLDLREKMKYCPHASTWLNHSRWNDEVVPGSSTTATPQKSSEEIESEQKEREKSQQKIDDYCQMLKKENPVLNKGFLMKVINPLKERLNESSWNTWIRPLIVIKADKQHIELFHPDPYGADWIEEHYLAIIEETIGIPVNITSMIPKAKEGITA